MSTILVKKGHVICPVSGIDGRFDILIEKGKISRIGKRLNLNVRNTFDASGLIVTPGLIDMHVHLREPGREDKETIQTASESAAAGGFTSIMAMPNTRPVADDQTVIEYISRKAAEVAVVNVFPIGTITKRMDGDGLAEMSDMQKSGAIALSDDGVDVEDSLLLREAMKYASMLDIPLISHCEDMDFAKQWAMSEGRMSTKLGLPGKPVEAEELGIARSAILVEGVGAQFHFTHINTKRSAEIIRDAKKRKARVTCDTCPHYFVLTEESLKGYDANYKMNPPLRSEEHVKAMKTFIKNGTIDAITTDHAPHLPIDKMLEFEDCENGIVGLETSLGLSLTHLVHEKVIDMSKLIELMSSNPARIMNLHERKGKIEKGFDGDLTIIDPDKEWIVDMNAFKSKGRNTPFHGTKLKGKAIAVVVGGNKIQY